MSVGICGDLVELYRFLQNSLWCFYMQNGKRINAFRFGRLLDFFLFFYLFNNIFDNGNIHFQLIGNFFQSLIFCKFFHD